MILVAATLVRTVVMFAVVELLGRHNRYLPCAMGWLPRVEVEGHHAPEPRAARGVGRSRACG